MTAANKNDVIKRWGNCYNRYYMLDTVYFMSDLTTKLVDILAKNFTWVSVLASAAKNDPEYRQQLTGRVKSVAKSVADASAGLSQHRGALRGFSGIPTAGRGPHAASTSG